MFTDTPQAVAINEAVELAKRFGSKQSSQFVNGILDGLRPKDASESSDKNSDADSDANSDIEIDHEADGHD